METTNKHHGGESKKKMNKVELAIILATKAHQGQTDRSQEPYILHPLAVGLKGKTDEERITGFLHDVIEDTDWTPEDLLSHGIPSGCVEAVKLLTHQKTRYLSEEENLRDYLNYISSIIDSHNPIALAVKINDVRHNLSRSPEGSWFQRKYQAAIRLLEKAEEERSRITRYEMEAGKAVAILACGCFWGVQHHFARKEGVVRTLVGYTGGKEEYPTYEQVRNHLTHHVEAIAIEYEPLRTDYRSLIQLFFEIHDPSQTDGQGPDKGEQYLSCIFPMDSTQERIAKEVIADLRARGHEVNTRIVASGSFWIAEEWHQHYYAYTGGEPYCHIRQKKF